MTELEQTVIVLLLVGTWIILVWAAVNIIVTWWQEFSSRGNSNQGD